MVLADFLDFASVRRAVDGVSTIYFAYPVQDGLLDATVNIAVAARDAGVTRLVDLVMLVSDPDAPTPRLRENYLSEQVLEWAGIGAVHVRATVFFENVRSLASATLAQGVFSAPLGSDATVLPLVAGEDVARVAVGLLTASKVVPGSSYPVIGEVLTVREIVAALARGLHRHVQYRAVPHDAWAQEAGARINAHAVAHLSKLWASFREPRPRTPAFAVTDAVRALSRRRPRTFAEFIADERGTFAAAPEAAPPAGAASTAP